MKTPMSTRKINRQQSHIQSLRQQAFFWFDMGERPSSVVRLIEIKFSTASRYFQQWKKLPHLYEGRYRYVRGHYKRLGRRDRETIAVVLAGELGTTKKSVLDRMDKPWALKQIVSGQWRQWIKPEEKSSRFGRISNRISKISLIAASTEAKQIIQLALHPEISLSDENIPDE